MISSFLLPQEKSLTSLEELRDLAFLVAVHLSEEKRPTLLLLRGDLGAGKTTFVGLLAEALLGSREGAASPTYALHHRYEGRSRRIDHWDLYRTQDENELEGAGFWESLEYEGDVVAIEWPDRVPKEHWPRSFQIMSFQFEVNGDQRTIKVRAGV